MYATKLSTETLDKSSARRRWVQSIWKSSAQTAVVGLFISAKPRLAAFLAHLPSTIKRRPGSVPASPAGDILYGIESPHQE
jgi:hypothetical protein